MKSVWYDVTSTFKKEVIEMGDQQQSNNQEEWKVIPFANKYSVSNIGRVKRNDSGIVRKPDIDKDGYHKYQLKDNSGRRRKFFSHRLVALIFIGETPGLDQVNHKNGVKDDNRVENLEWTTSSGNRQHAFDSGIQKPVYGEAHGNAVLTSELAREIGRLYSEGKTNGQIAKTLRVTRGQVGDVTTGRCWLRDTAQYLPEIEIGKKYSDELVHQICKMFSEGYCRQDIRRTFANVPLYVVTLIHLKRTRLHVVTEYKW